MLQEHETKGILKHKAPQRRDRANPRKTCTQADHNDHGPQLLPRFLPAKLGPWDHFHIIAKHQELVKHLPLLETSSTLKWPHPISSWFSNGIRTRSQ